MNSILRNLLTKILPGWNTPLFKNYNELFEKIISTPGHDFYAPDLNTRELMKNRFKQRWNNLTKGKRNNPIDEKVEKALTIVLQIRIVSADKQMLIEQIINALRNSARVPKITSQISVPAVYSPVNEKSSTIPINEIGKLRDSIRVAKTVEIVLDDMFANSLFSSNSYREISSILWNTIIINVGPNIRLYVPWDETKSIWLKIKAQLSNFLCDCVSPLLNGINADNIYDLPVIRYENEELVTKLIQLKNIDDNDGVSRVTNEIIERANDKEKTKTQKTRFVIIGLKIPKRFSEPHFVIDPNDGETKIFSVDSDDDVPQVKKQNSSVVYRWLKNDKVMYQAIYDNVSVRDNFTKKSLYKDEFAQDG